MCNIASYSWLSAIPRFVTMLENQHVKENENATFACEVYPTKSVLTWFMNDHKIKDDRKYKMTSTKGQRQVVIKDVKEEDAKTVKASLGEPVSEADLTVEGEQFFC